MRRVMSLALAACLAALPPAAFADPGKGKDKGHGKGRSGDARPVVVIDAPSHRDWGRGCPPGLAKKGNGCQPPGQARKNGVAVFDPVVVDPVVVLPRIVAPAPRPVVVAPRPRPVVVAPGPVVVAHPPRRPSNLLITPAAVPVVVGQRYDDVRYVTDPGRYGLAPAQAGSRYGIVGNQLVQLDSRTNTVLALIRLVEAVLD